MTLQDQLKIMRDATVARMPGTIMKVFTDSINTIKRNRLKENALQLGETIPNIPLTNVQGLNIYLNSLIRSNYLILNFYRGGWCPYCNMELREYEKLMYEFNEIGADLVAISSEIPELAKQTIGKNSILSYPVLTDNDALFMKAMGIVFRLDEASKREFVNFGMDFSKINGNENYELPVPAVYVINKEMKIVFVHFEEDYMTRLEPKQLLTLLKKETISKI
ncbi:peroxiredoxin-like family protein [Aquimarina sp. AU474]|uniref:peroxiredoxin-like family protein n=1 Tax=Aquimarina sp. AU474 TaxID=2108529 RepID=UPI000D68C329|nr:peroxiredoxin-like family protein [Aquimarina sp. AU474]